MARYNRAHLLKHIDAALVAVPTYFIVLDVTARMREDTGENPDTRTVREVMVHHERAQRTGITVRRCGTEWAVMKKYGAPQPPEDWEYGEKVGA